MTLCNWAKLAYKLDPSTTSPCNSWMVVCQCEESPGFGGQFPSRHCRADKCKDYADEGHWLCAKCGVANRKEHRACRYCGCTVKK